MSQSYDESYYYIDFSKRDGLSESEKLNLEDIQTKYRPLERVEYLNTYKMMGKITTDDFETMTGTPYTFG